MSIEIEDYKNVDLLLNNVHAFRKSDIEIRKATGARYNMFNVLKVRRKELKHSLVIGDLLNPKGRHDQGDLYLKLFLDVIKSGIENE